MVVVLLSVFLTASLITGGGVYGFSDASDAAAPGADVSPDLLLASSTGVISVDDFADYRVFQRDTGETSRSVPITGTYADMDWDHVEARILRHGTDAVVVDWITIDLTPGEGVFSGNLTVPQGGWYSIEVRALDGAGAVLGTSRGTHKWGVGMIILCIGQSNMSGRGQPPFTPATSDLAVNYNNTGTWEHLADPYDDESPAGAVDEDSSAGGSMIPGIANSLLQTFDFPIAFVPAAKGGSNLYVNGSNYGWAYRDSSNHFDTSTLYGQSITKAQSVGGVELIIMHQGEADLSSGRTEANYEADFATMIGHYRQDLSANIPIFICQLGTVGSGTNDGATGVRNAQHDLDNGTSIFMGATAMDLPRLDIWHYTTPALTLIGSRLGNAIKYYYGQSTYYRGPSISSAFFGDTDRSQVIVTLDHHGGTDITPATGITGFAVFDNGVSVSIGSAARYSSNAVLLTLSRSITAGHTVTLRYLYGTTPNVSGLVKDDSPLTLPLENSIADVTVASTFPVVSGIPDQTITEGQTFATINLDTYVTDPDNSDAQMTWTCSGNSQLTVSINASRVATISVPSPDWTGSETITFRATDPGSLYDDDAATFTVTDVAENVAPQITSNGGGATASVNAAENQTAVTDVNATDADPAPPSPTASMGEHAAKFAINPSTGVLTFLAAPDYENPTDVGGNNVYDVTVQVSDGSLTDTQAISVTVTDVAETAPTLTFTSPFGLGSYTSAQSFTASWNADRDLDAGQFGVWVRSAAGSWYIGQLVPTNAGDDVLTYSASLPLSTVPAGFYQAIVGYRPTVGSGTFVSWATSYGFVFEVGDAPTPVVDITQPTGQQSYTSAQSFTATWTASPSLTTGQFAVWVRSPGNTWYWKSPLVAATGAGSYSAPVNLSGVTPGLGYQVIVAYEPVPNTSLWSSWATSPGVFSVDATAPVVTVTQPSGGSYTTSQSVTANWTTSTALAAGGQFGLWVRSGSGGWYATTLVPATGTAGALYSTSLPLSTVPTGIGNEVIIAYRPVAGTGAFMSWATSPGVFAVTAD